MFEILRSLASFCWSFTKWALVFAVVGGLAAIPYLYRRIDDVLRSEVEGVFAAHYRGLSVHVKSAELVDGGIHVRGVSIADPRADGPLAELAYFDELLLGCDTEITALVKGLPQISKIVARRPTIRAARRADGSWSASRLFPLPKLGDQPPEIVIESATMEIFDPLKNPTSTLVLREGHLKVVSLAAPTNPASSRRPPLAIRGYLTAEHARRIEVDGSFDPDGGGWSVSGRVEGLDVGPELCHCLPGEAPAKISVLETLRGEAEAQFSARYDAAAQPPLDFHVTGQFQRGRVDDARLPHPWTDLRASFRATPQGFAVENLTATSGAATLRLDVARAGYGANAPLRLAAEARHLQLDRHLVEILPPSWQETWRQFSPAGEVDLDARLVYDGTQWQPDVAVTCHNVAFSYYKFPYRLEHSTGTLSLKDHVLRLGLTAYSDVDEVRIDGEIHQPGPAWHGSFQIRGNNLRIDEKLSRALPPKPRDLVRSFNAHGSINLFVRYWRDAQAGAALHNYFWIGLTRCGMRYEKFPYPLSNVRGVVEATDDHWAFHDLEGTNDTGQVRCQGEMTPASQGGVLALHITGLNVPLEEELRDALRPSARLLWNELRPAGAVNLQVEVRNQADWREPRIDVVAAPVPDTVSIEPAAFPYRLDRVQGEFAYHNGQVEIRRFRAEHGPGTRIAARGSSTVDAAGGWRLQLENLTAGRLYPDRDLMQALPPRLKKAINELGLVGPVALSGALDLTSTGRPGDRMQVGWNLRADLQQARITRPVLLDNINGRLLLAGRFDGQQLGTSGELDLDSMTYKDFQFTEVRGPLWLDDARTLLGGAVKPAAGQPERSVTARCCGGIVTADGWVMLGSSPRYNLDATVSQAQLGRCAREILRGRQQLSGEVAARVNLHGQGSGTSQLGGWGSIQLRNADIYELPIMVSLLKILSIRAPDTSAFSKSDIDFRIEGEHVYFSRIDFNGDAISLRGTGEMGLDKSLGLKFYTVVGRDEMRVPLVSEILGGASQQLMEIYVEGSLDQPLVRKQALPAVTEALQQLQADLQGMRAQPGLPPSPGRAPAAVGTTPHRR